MQHSAENTGVVSWHTGNQVDGSLIEIVFSQDLAPAGNGHLEVVGTTLVYTHFAAAHMLMIRRELATEHAAKWQWHPNMSKPYPNSAELAGAGQPR